MPPGFSVKRANLTYARRIPGVHIRAVRTTYQNDLPQSYLSSLNVKNDLPGTRKNVQDPRRCMYVLLHGTRVIGYVEAGILAAAGQALLINEYILDAYRDQGLGSCLLLPAVDCLIAKQRFVMAGHVATSNTRMRHVCTSKWHGHFTGNVDMEMGPHHVPGCEYVWDLANLRATLLGLCD